jgi:hypothetical protein
LITLMPTKKRMLTCRSGLAVAEANSKVILLVFQVIVLCR